MKKEQMDEIHENVIKALNASIMALKKEAEWEPINPERIDALSKAITTLYLFVFEEKAF